VGIERGNWWLAGVTAGLASATRPTGLIVGLAVVVAYGLDWLRTRHPLRPNVLALALTPLGTVLYAVYCLVRFGDPLAYVKASAGGWGGGHLQLGGVWAVVTTLAHPGAWLHTYRVAVVFAAYALGVVIFLAATYAVWRLLGVPYALYALLSCLAPVLDFGTLMSLGRYLSVIFPVFIVLAYALRRRPIWRDLTLITLAMLLAVYTLGFTGGYGLS